MKIEAFLLCWNEKDIIPFVIRHYQKFCDRITIMDNHSTDGSAELARSLGCEVIPFGTKFFDDQVNMDMKNNCWKGSDADWVVVADFDEILLHTATFHTWFPLSPKFIRVTLDHAAYRMTPIFKTTGWQMMSEGMPKDDLLELNVGYEFSNYAKSILFSPKELSEVNFNPGAHRCDPKDLNGKGEGYIKWGSGFHVLHYKHIGGVERTIKRYKEYQKRMSPYNRKHGHGRHYSQNERLLRREWAERMAKSKSLMQ